MVRKSTLAKLHQPAVVTVKFGGDKVKIKFDRLSEVFNNVKDNSTISNKLIALARKQLGYDRKQLLVR